MLLVCSDLQVMTSWITEKPKVEALTDASISQTQITRACKNAWQMHKSQMFMLKIAKMSHLLTSL